MSTLGLNFNTSGINHLASIHNMWQESEMSQLLNKATTDPLPPSDVTNTGATPPPSDSGVENSAEMSAQSGRDTTAASMMQLSAIQG